MKEKRIQVGGRRLQHAEFCDVVGSYAVDSASSTTFTTATFAGLQRIPGFRSCDLRRFAALANLPARSLRANRTEVDWLDSLLNDPSEWTGQDEGATIAEDIATLNVIYPALSGVISSASSAVTANASVASLVAQWDTAGSETAEFIGQVAGLATLSVEYWDAHLDEWLAENCEEGGSEGPIVDPDLCDDDPPPSDERRSALGGSRANTDISPTLVRVAVGDLTGLAGPLGGVLQGMYEGYTTYRAGLSALSALEKEGVAIVARQQGAAAMTKSMAKGVMKNIFRMETLTGGIAGAVVGSALSLL